MILCWGELYLGQAITGVVFTKLLLEPKCEI